MNQNAKTLIGQDPDKIQEIFIEQITILTKKTNIIIRQLPIFEYLGIEDVTPRGIKMLQKYSNKNKSFTNIFIYGYPSG